MAQTTNVLSGDPPALDPAWLLQPLPARDAASPDLDPTDTRFTAMLDLVTRGDYVTAARRAEQALHEGLHDVRVLGYYLYGYFIEKGPTSLPQIYRMLAQILGPSSEAMGPRDKRDVHIENTLQWLFTSMLRNVEHHSRSQDDTWKLWMDNATRPAIDAALEFTSTLQPLVVQNSAKSRAALRFQSLDAWLRGLERPAPPPAAPAPAGKSGGAASGGEGSRDGASKKAAKAEKPPKERKRSAREIAEEAKRYSLSFDLGDGHVASLGAAPMTANTDADEDEDAPEDEPEDERSEEPSEDDGPPSRLADGDEDEDAAPQRRRADAARDEDEDEAPARQPLPLLDEDEEPRVSSRDRDKFRVKPRSLFPQAARWQSSSEDEEARAPRKEALRDDEEDRSAPPPAARPRGRVDGDRGADSGLRPLARARAADSPSRLSSLDGQPAGGSPEWDQLLLRLRAFEEMLESGDYMKAAVLAHDIQQAIATFDPVRYFPSVFAGYLAAFSANMHPLETCLKDSGSVQFRVLQKLFQVSPDDFLRRR